MSNSGAYNFASSIKTQIFYFTKFQKSYLVKYGKETFGIRLFDIDLALSIGA